MKRLSPRRGHTPRELVQAVRCGASLGKAEHSALALHHKGVSTSCKLRLQDQAAKAGVPETMRYDLVNLGREAAVAWNKEMSPNAVSSQCQVLGKVSNRFFAQMVNATTPSEARRNRVDLPPA